MNIEEIAKIQTTQNTELRNKIKELEQQNAELVAHCEAQKDLLNAIALGTSDAWVYNDIKKFSCLKSVHES